MHKKQMHLFYQHRRLVIELSDTF